MKGISELEESELKQYGIPIPIWEEKVNEFKDNQYIENIVKIKPIYSGNSKRPHEFIIIETINGKELIKHLKNTPTGE